MTTVRLVVRYDGSGLSGWQRQRGVRTVQAEIEQALHALTGTEARVHGAGRTDAGVHALAQVAAFETSSTLPMKAFRLGLTSKLPPEIAVHDARVVRDDYDPRRASAGKRYRYLVLASRVRDPLLRERAWLVHEPLDLEAMRAAARPLIGWNDFRAFRAADCERVSTTRCVFRAELTENFAGVDGLLAFTIEGTAFLKNMVRIITGTLVDVGRGRLDPSVVRERLADGDRTRAGMTAPAHGLYLVEVFQRREFLLDDDVLCSRPEYADLLVDSAVSARLPPSVDAEARAGGEGGDDDE